MDTSGDITTGRPAITNYTSAPLGSFPIVDLELVKDYGRPADDLLRQYFRIHMDIPISDPRKFEKIRNALDGGNKQEAYADIKSNLPPKNSSNRRAYGVVEAALKFDPTAADVAPDRLMPKGTFPIQDLQLVTDYGRPAEDPLRQFFRIHVDIPIADTGKFRMIREDLDNGRRAEGYETIKSTLPAETPGNRRAREVVYAALVPEDI